MQLDQDQPIFTISAAAALAQMHPQTLRQYDRLGLVEPKRTVGQSRRYSMRDVAQLQEIARLTAEGLNLTGIARILELENQLAAQTKKVQQLQQALAEAVLTISGQRVYAADITGDVTVLRKGQRPTKRNEIELWQFQRRG